jgi:hypothetical protein
MSITKRLLLALCVTAQLSACASQGTLDSLRVAKLDCEAGKTQRCADATTWERMASDERKDNAGKIALAVVAVPLILGIAVLAGAAASQPTYQSSTTCSSWGRSSTCTTRAW